MNLNIEGRKIGPDHQSFLIAELSANHDRDLDQALALVDAAAAAGWHSVKFQTYTADSLTLNSDHPSMQVDPIWGATNLYELYRDAAMPMEFNQPLFARAREKGVVPFTSIYDPRDLDVVEDLDCPLYKIASFEMTFDDLLIAIAGTGKPVIMSTGMANLNEVDHALEVLTRAGAGPVILLHCVSAYPTPHEAMNLRAIDTLRARYGEMIGLSDHSTGAQAAVAAAAMGAVAIEKHITNDPTRPGPDHRFSATPETLREIAVGTAAVHQMRGGGEKTTAELEMGNKALGRRSAFALRDLQEGHTISSADFRFVRPGVGIPPTDAAALDGKRLVRMVPFGHPITYEDIAE